MATEARFVPGKSTDSKGVQSSSAASEPEGAQSSAIADPVLLAAKAGDAAAFENLMHKYHDALLRRIMLVVRESNAAEDVSQETWVRIHRGLKGFEGRSGFFAWAVSIAVREGQRWLVRRRESAAELPDVAARERENPVDADLVQMCLQRLPEEFREPLLLELWEGFSHKEISEALGIPEGTVKSRLFRARERFRALWETRGSES